MASWSSDNKVEMKYHDSYGIKNKLRQHLFEAQEDFDSVLKLYEILNSQHTRSLVSINSLKSKIQILDHQVMAAKIVKNDFNGRVLLADEVGLAKTIEVGILSNIGIKNPKAHLQRSYNDFPEEYKNRIDKELGV